MKNVPVKRSIAAGVAAWLFVAPGFAAPRQTPPAPVPTKAKTFAPKYLEEIPLRFADAATLAKTLNAAPMTTGVKQIKVDPKKPKALLVLGTADGIAALKTLVSLVDVKPKKATYQVIIERTQFAANGERYANPVATKTLTLTSNEASRFVVTDSHGETIAVALTARMHDPAKQTLLATLGWMTKKESTVGLEAFMPLPTANEKVRVVGVTFADETAFIAALGAGKIPGEWQGRQIAYILYVKPITAPK